MKKVGNKFTYPSTVSKVINTRSMEPNVQVKTAGEDDDAIQVWQAWDQIGFEPDWEEEMD